jgi:hypothetical protein
MVAVEIQGIKLVEHQETEGGRGWRGVRGSNDGHYDLQEERDNCLALKFPRQSQRPLGRNTYEKG